MPISRKKACEQCRLAKARCSLESVCSRCLNRGLTCEYNRDPARPGPYTRPHLLVSERHLPLASPTVTIEPFSSLFSPSDMGFPYLDFEPGRLLREDLALGIGQPADRGSCPADESRGISLGRATLNRSEAAAPPTLTVDSSSHEAHCAFTLNGPTTPIFPGPSIGTPQLADTQLNGNTLIMTDNTTEPVSRVKNLTQPGFSSPLDDAELSSDMEDNTTIVVQERLHERLGTLTTEQAFMARILISQVENYPRMLTYGSRLPPFIHPQCVMHNKLCHQCVAENGTHQCLPEPLANCAASARMFYNRSSNNARFVWKTIIAEQKRLYEQYPTYDIPTLLAAVQAVLIYILMQTQDPESMAKNEAVSLAATLADMITSLHYQSKYHISILHDPDLSQSSWVVHESIRRTMNLFYVIGIVMIIRIGKSKQAGCSSIRETPLPCGRELWEPEATETFAIRLHRYKSRLVSSRGLVINDLYRTLSPAQSGQSDTIDPRVQKDLVTWCENLDDLGTLVWMALLLDRQPG